MFNPWKHLRIAGGLTTLVGVLMQHTLLIIIGLTIQYVGALGSIDLLERRVNALTTKEDKDASNRD